MSVKAKFNSEQLEALIRERAKKRLLAIGFQIERDAKKAITDYGRIDTGRLRASISTNWTDSGMERGKTGTYTQGYQDRTGYGVSDKKEAGSRAIKGEGGGADGIGCPPTQNPNLFQVVVGTNVRYAPFIEFGTSKMWGSPFLRTAFEKNRGLLKGTTSRIFLKSSKSGEE